MNRLTIKSPAGHGADTTIELDGEPVQNCRAVTVNLAADRWATATIELLLDPPEFDGNVVASLSAANIRTLLALGWTPPGGK